MVVTVANRINLKGTACVFKPHAFFLLIIIGIYKRLSSPDLIYSIMMTSQSKVLETFVSVTVMRSDLKEAVHVQMLHASHSWAV